MSLIRLSRMASGARTVAGVDVGAPRKGYHAVALGADGASTFHSCDAAEVAAWCRAAGAEVVAVDAPCRWRVDGQPARAAERELAAERISCFSTPTEEKARGHAFYTWMFAGQELYAVLAATHPIYAGGPRPTPVCIETFPQAVACALAGERVSAKTKRAVRRAVLERAGINLAGLTTIDEIDAALCAVAAQRFALNRFKAYGDAAGGFIVVPSESVGGRDESGGADGALPEILKALPRLTAAGRQTLRRRLEELG